jgi:hypothetical protein
MPRTHAAGIDGRQLARPLTRQTYLSHFRMARIPGMRVSNLIVDHNLEAFARIVTAKYSRRQVGA